MPRPTIHHLYVHIPFCASVCPYCAFYVHTGSASDQKRFVQALKREMALLSEVYDLRRLNSIYLGGGTPSMFNAPLFRDLASGLPPQRNNAKIEYTIEANPATVTDAKVAAWKEAGVNRISLGAQSFDPGFLKLLGRQHKPRDIPATMKQLRAAGFDNINIDLMFALPNQPEKIWHDTLAQALDCKPDHLSAYGLTYEEDTPFFEHLQHGRFGTEAVDEEREKRMFEYTYETLEAAGLKNYEVSNYSRSRFESLHNRAYWHGIDYVSAGPSAWSTVGNERWRNLPDTKKYSALLLDAPPEKPAAKVLTSLQSETEKLTAKIKRTERVMFGLRTREGVLISDITSHRKICERLIDEGLAYLRWGRLTLTPRGRIVADSIAAEFA